MLIGCLSLLAFSCVSENYIRIFCKMLSHVLTFVPLCVFFVQRMLSFSLPYQSRSSFEFPFDYITLPRSLNWLRYPIVYPYNYRAFFYKCCFPFLFLVNFSRHKIHTIYLNTLYKHTKINGLIKNRNVNRQ